MRTLILGAVLAFSAPALACPMADAAAYEASAQKVQAATGTKVALTVAGMHCGSCSEKVTAKLSTVPGVTAAAVDYQNGVAQVAYDPKVVKPEALVEAVKAAGFTATVKSI